MPDFREDVDRMERGQSWKTLVDGKLVEPNSPKSSETVAPSGIDNQDQTRTGRYYNETG